MHLSGVSLRILRNDEHRTERAKECERVRAALIAKRKRIGVARTVKQNGHQTAEWTANNGYNDNNAYTN